MDFKVKCVKVKKYPGEYFTEGKIYNVVNGVIYDDRGRDYRTWSDPMCGDGNGNNFESLVKWFAQWFDFELVTETKFKVGDMVIGNDPYRYAYTKKGWIGEVKKVHSDGRIDAYGKRGDYNDYMTFTFLEPQYFDLHASKSEKIVITHDGKTTTATLYRDDGSKEVATAKCCPEDTFDFNVGAKLSMERLMKKVEPVETHKYAVGDRIFAEDNINCYPGGAWGTVVQVLDKSCNKEDYLVKFDGGHLLCSHVAPVPTTPEPPKYFNGKAVCVESPAKWWTKGKIYTFVDGITVDDEGDKRYEYNPVKNISEVSHIFIPIVE